MKIISWKTKKMGARFEYVVTSFESSDPRAVTNITIGSRPTRAQASGVAKKYAGALRRQVAAA